MSEQEKCGCTAYVRVRRSDGTQQEMGEVVDVDEGETTEGVVFTDRCKYPETKAALDAAIKDLESGFMAGAYARLQNLQEKERLLDAANALGKRLAPEWLNRHDSHFHLTMSYPHHPTCPECNFLADFEEDWLDWRGVMDNNWDDHGDGYDPDYDGGFPVSDEQRLRNAVAQREEQVADLTAENSRLRAELEKCQREKSNWEDTAARHCRNEQFYRDLLIGIGERFGVEAKTSDDGSIQEDVLCLKVPKLVAKLASDLATAKGELRRLAKAAYDAQWCAHDLRDTGSLADCMRDDCREAREIWERYK